MNTDVTLAELASDGGVQFIPKFHSGRSFIVTSNGVFVRGPYGAETFREVRTRDLNLECGYDDSDGSRNPFLYFGNNYKTLMDMLVRSGKYHTKRIAGMGVVASELIAVSRTIKAGTWSSPNTAGKVSKLVGIYRSLKAGRWPTGVEKKVTDILYAIMGDDDLFDKLDSAWKHYQSVNWNAPLGRPENSDVGYMAECAAHIESKIKEWIKNGSEVWVTPSDYDMIVRAGRQMGIRTASRNLTGNSGEIVANGISKAISALSYLPTSAAFMDDKKNRELGKKVEAIVRELSDLLAELPVSVTYTANIDGDSLRTNDPVKLVEFMRRHGRKQKGFSESGGMTRKWLWDQPVFENMAGPMSDGPNVCRYETWEQYDRLTI